MTMRVMRPSQESPSSKAMASCAACRPAGVRNGYPAITVPPTSTMEIPSSRMLLRTVSRLTMSQAKCSELIVLIPTWFHSFIP